MPSSKIGFVPQIYLRQLGSAGDLVAGSFSSERLARYTSGRRDLMRKIVLTLAALTSALAQSSSSCRVTHTYPLGGDGSWDYSVPDPPGHRLFIARQNRVMVVDEDK